MASKRIMSVIGLNGQVELLPDRVVIHRHGIFNALKYGINATREIPIKSISEISFRPATFGMGIIEFVRAGKGGEIKGKAKPGSGESAVTFNRKQTEKFAELKEKVFELINESHTKSK